MRLFPILFVIVVLLIGGCGNQEEKARALYNKALTEFRAGNVDEARNLYQKIVDKYPGTELAVQVNEQLASGELLDRAAIAAKKDIKKKIIEQGLMLYKLDNGEYPYTEQGLLALVSPPTSGRLAKKWRGGGYIENPEILSEVSSYSYEPGGTPEVIMK